MNLDDSVHILHEETKHVSKYLTEFKGKVSSFQKVKGRHFNNVSKKEKTTIKVFDMCNYKVLKSRDITLQTKAHLVKAMIFPVFTYRCKSWNIKKVEC